MASQTQPITTTDVPNFSAGEIFTMGKQAGTAPLLSLAGLNGGWKTGTAAQFAMSNILTLDAAAQDGVTEDAQLAAGSYTSYAGGQNTNYMQDFQKRYAISYARQALANGTTGVNVAGQPVADVGSLAVQREAHLLQLLADLSYSALQGTAQARTNAATAAKMQGITTNLVANTKKTNSTGDLEADLQTEIARMVAAGARPSDTFVLACGAARYMDITNTFSFAPQDRNIGGTDLSTIILPVLGQVAVINDEQIPSDQVLVADIDHLKVVFGVVDGKSNIVVEPIAKIGAGDYEQIWFTASIDWDDDDFHGLIDGIA